MSEAAIVIVFFVIVFLISKRKRNRRPRSVEVWEEFAKNHSSTLEPPSEGVKNIDDIGSVRLKKGGRTILASGYAKESGDAVIPASRITMHIGNFEADVWIIYSLGRWIQHARMTMVKTGYEAFDKRFEVYSEQALWTKRALSTGDFLRQHLMDNGKDFSILLGNGELIVDKVGAPKFTEELDELLDFALEVAAHFESTTVPSLADQRRAIGALSLSEEEDAEGALTLTNAPEGAISTSKYKEERDD